MKILSDKEYQALLAKVNGGETKKEAELKEEVKFLNESLLNAKKDAENKEKDTEIILKRKDNELENKVFDLTKELRDDLADKNAKLNNATKEVEILTKAFENLGFDVKDMKAILDKLVDGIVSKNTIQLVK